MDTEVLYNQALDYIYSFIDYSREKTDKLVRANFKLERMSALLEALGDPQDSYPTIHVAGTKGKGSTCALIASALTAAGYKTGLYTSPHLQEFDERIQIDGQPIPHLELYQLIEEMKPAIQAVPHITTFEVITALAFLFFARQKVEAAVIEVGLGGRLDATNILKPCVSVITSISYDHMAVLGNTLAAIAGEKAGIIKPGIPVVSSPQKEEALLVLERIAGERQAPLTLVGRDVEFQALEHSIDGQTLRVFNRPIANHQSKIKYSDILRIPLLGRHQEENAATACTALQVSRLPITRKAIRAGFASVDWPCRFELARREPPVIFDSAHNQDSFLRLCQALDDYFPGKPVILLMGASEDKNLAGMLAEIKPRLSLLIAIRADHPRALPPEQIVSAARAQGIPAQAAVSVQAALARALALSTSGGDILLAAGSMFATAEIKTAWQRLFPEYH
jgi:dihydrofolate synthase/folylpolyglutamate synthase